MRPCFPLDKPENFSAKCLVKALGPSLLCRVCVSQLQTGIVCIQLSTSELSKALKEHFQVYPEALTAIKLISPEAYQGVRLLGADLE